MMVTDIFIRLTLATLLSGLVGYDAEFHDRPAGIKTHILVCVGACILAMIQIDITLYSGWIEALGTHGEFLKIDPTRLVAQIVSGIGFLGAGTIIVTKQSVQGLSTAASLWAISGIGIAVGFGFYKLALLGTLFIYLILVFVFKFIRFKTLKQIELQCLDEDGLQDFVNNLFKKLNISIKDTSFYMDNNNQNRIYTYIYTVEMDAKTSTEDILKDLSSNKKITSLKLISF